jgi:multiple sugar transport system permease protein
MTLRSELAVGVARQARRTAPVRSWLDRESVFSWLMMAPPLLFLAALVGYPFCYGILLSLQDRPVAHAGTFVGLKNFATNFNDPIFWRVAANTFLYTIVATLLKMVGGLALALAMNQQFPLKNLVRALLLLPFIVPTVLSTVAWMWILDPAFSVLNWFLIALGVPKPGPSWLGNPVLAMGSIIFINTWRGLPFYGAARALRGRHNRRRQRLAALPLRHVAVIAADHSDRDPVFGDFYIC